MSQKTYTALHSHTDNSILDGYGTVCEYCDRAKELGMIGCGITDHGTAAGLFQLISYCKKIGIIPVPGVEMYMAPENPEGAKYKKPVFYGRGGNKAPKYDVANNGAYLHLTVWAYNNTGLSNLFKLSSMAWEPENYYSHPRIDTEMLAAHSEGLIVSSGCPSSEICKRFLLNQDKKAYEYASRLKDIFGDNFYVELMNHNMESDDMERILYPKLIKMARDLDIKMIATNDSHYTEKTDAAPHERMLCMQSGKRMEEPSFKDGGSRFAFGEEEYYLKTYDEMLALFPEDVAAEALENTNEIAQKASQITLDYNTGLRPKIDIPEGETPLSYFKKLINNGWREKRGNADPETQAISKKKIREELEVLHSNDFITYFLVVYDYINYAHENNISIGPGRGSVGGSEIAYVLDVSDTDPIRYGLLFERFLSPGRGSIYLIEYEDGTTEELSVSDIKQVAGMGKKVKKYTHELVPGDLVFVEEDDNEPSEVSH